MLLSHLTTQLQVALFTFFTICAGQIVFEDTEERSNRSPNANCVTPDNKMGRCVRWNNCRSLRRITNWNRLQPYVCGFAGSEPRVCCSLEPDDPDVFFPTTVPPRRPPPRRTTPLRRRTTTTTPRPSSTPSRQPTGDDGTKPPFLPNEEDVNSKNGSECAGQKSLAYIELSKKMISELRKNFPICSNLDDKDQKDKDQKEKDQKEKDQKEKDQKEKDQKEKDQKEKEQKEKDQKEKEQKEKDQKEKEQKEKEQREKEQKEKEQKEKDQKEKEQKEKDQKEKEQKEKDQKEKEQKEKDQKEKEQKEKEQKEKDDKIVEEKARNCLEILRRGHRKSGIYTIWPGETLPAGKSVQVYCDLETDGGGWTLIQRRGKYPIQQDFQKNWETYKKGFGNLREEFWLGNENIRALCNEECILRLDLQDQKGERGFGLYNTFKLSGNNYRLTLSDFKGNIGDIMHYSNTYEFSTKDRGNTQFAIYLKGGWWHVSGAYYCNLNGLYQDGQSNVETVHWYTWRYYENLATVEMKVRQK